jgi:hypothetical protein
MNMVMFTANIVVLLAITTGTVSAQEKQPPQNDGALDYATGPALNYSQVPSQIHIDNEIAAMTRGLTLRREDYRHFTEDRNKDLARNIEMMDRDHQRYVEDYRRDVEDRYRQLEEEVKGMREYHNKRMESYRKNIEERIKAFDETLQQMQKDDETQIANRRKTLGQRLLDYNNSIAKN